MTSAPTINHILLITITLYSLIAASLEYSITTVDSVSTSPYFVNTELNIISVQGGAYLYIKGSGFSTQPPTNNFVYVGGKNCSIIEFLTTSTQIVCEAPSFLIETTVSVQVSGADLRILTCPLCTIKYSYSKTPRLLYLDPNAGSPGDEIFFTGRFLVNSSADIEYIKIGDYQCYQNDYDDIEFGANYNNKVSCKIPLNMQDGVYSLTLKTKGSTGFASLMTPTFAVLPRIDSISNNVTSSEGQIIDIYGRGFATWNYVRYGENACKVLNQTATRITCQCPGNNPGTNKGFHTGLSLDVYAEKSIADIKSGNAGVPTLKKTVLVPEVSNLLEGNYSAKISGYFWVTSSGAHRFVVSGSDKVQLYFSPTPTPQNNLNLLLNIEYPTPYKFFYTKESTQISEPVILQNGYSYYFELYYQSFANSSGGFVTLGVEWPYYVHPYNLPVLHSISINCQMDFETIHFRLVNVKGGFWRIRFDTATDSKRIFDSRVTTNIPVHVLPDTLANIIRSCTGVDVQVSKYMYTSEGLLTQIEALAQIIIYEVIFLGYRTSNLIPTIESANLTGKDFHVKVSQLQAPSPPLRGAFTLGRPGKSVYNVNYNASAEEIENIIHALGYSDPIRVVRYGNVDLGAEWLVQFSGQEYETFDLIGMASTLTGSKSAIFVTVTPLLVSTQGWFYEVIPYSLLQTANDKPQITVTGNNWFATCPNRNCDFEVLPLSTLPKLLSFSYTDLFLFNLYVEDKGMGMPLFTKEDIHVILGDNECEVMSYNSGSTPSEIIAQCPLECGSYLPKVHYNRIGYAKNDNNTMINFQLKIADSSPQLLNRFGGEILTLTGEGFPNSKAIAEKRSMQVTVGGFICSLISVNPTEIKCLTPVSADPTVSVLLNGMTSTVYLAFSPNYLTLGSVSPSIIQPLVETVITVTGTGFEDNIYTKVLFGKQQITPISITPTQLTFKSSGVHTGYSQVYIQSLNGKSEELVFIQSQMNLASVSPNFGSAGGGLMITIRGEYFGEHAHYVSAYIDDLPCDIKKVTPTLIECETPPQTNNSKIDRHSSVFVYIRGDQVGYFGSINRFTYLTSSTLKISEITSDKGVLQAGNHYLILGSGFGDTSTYPVEVSIDGITCNINGYLSGGVSFAVPAEITPNDAAVIKVFQAGRGNALFEVSNRVKVVPNIIAIPSLNRAPGGTLMKIAGTGFAEGIKIKVGDIPCEIKACSAREISCKVTSSGLVTLEYKDFVNIQYPNWVVTLDNSFPVVITSVYPLNIPAFSNPFDLTINLIQVRFFIIRAFLVSQFDPSLRFEGSNVIFTSVVSSSFVDIPAGNYTVEVLDDNNFAVNASDFTVPVVIPLRVEKLFTIGSPLSGGQTVDIGGYGFFNDARKEKNLVTICGFPCKVVESSLTSIKCLSPPFKNAAVKAAYPQTFPIEILKGITWSNTGNEGVVFDNNLTTVYSSAQSDCLIGFGVGIDLVAELSEVRYFLSPYFDPSSLMGIIFEGSNDNVTYREIPFPGSNIYSGWNSIRFEHIDYPMRYRFYRFRSGFSTAKCALAEIQFKGHIFSNNDANDLNNVNCSARVTVNGKSSVITNFVTYKKYLTPNVTSISPRMGPSSGGTIITLTGENFPIGLGKVFIDDIECVITSATTDTISCKTGPAPDISIRTPVRYSKLKVSFNNVEAFTNNIQFFYVDEWSKISTWGGLVPPREGESIIIPTGQAILLDVSPPKLGRIKIEGALIFDDNDITLSCESILVLGGMLRIGTQDNPIQNNINITLSNEQSLPSIPFFGNKFIGVKEGILDIHGKERSHTWTALESTAEIGNQFIQVIGAVDWNIGEEIVISSTNEDAYQSETRVISSISQVGGSTKITFTEPLQYIHFGEIYSIDDKAFEMRAEVGLLSRNVVIQGDEENAGQRDGAYIKITSDIGDDNSIARISFTEIRRAGQSQIPGRYPIYFHFLGDARKSFFIGNSIHHTYQRGLAIHGTNLLLIQRNVAYWIEGHAIFTEDGVETENTIEDNLVINTLKSPFLSKSDQYAAAFYINNPRNYLRRNIAAGSDNYGFWFNLPEFAIGASSTTTVCPRGEVLGEFKDNQAHSNRKHGLIISPKYVPRMLSCLPYDSSFPDNSRVTAEFIGFFGWKNVENAIYAGKVSGVTFRNITAIGNFRAGIEIAEGAYPQLEKLHIEDAWIVGIRDVFETLLYENNQTRGIILPKTDNSFVKNTFFANFNNDMAAIETYSKYKATDQLIHNIYFSGITYYTVYLKFRFPSVGFLVDQDGSLGGLHDNGVIVPYYAHLYVSGCLLDSTQYSLTCDQTVSTTKIRFYDVKPMQTFANQTLKIMRMEDNPTGEWSEIQYNKLNQSWTVPFIANHTYKISWGNNVTFDEIFISPSTFLLSHYDHLTLVFDAPSYIQRYEIITQLSKWNITSSPTLWDNTNINLKVSGEWHHNSTSGLLYVVINGQYQDFSITAIKCYNCQDEISHGGSVRLWSDPSIWPYQRLPLDGENVIIPSDWTIYLDVNTSRIGTLTIEGDLYFDYRKDYLILTAERIQVKGQLFIGNSSEFRYKNKAKIQLTGNRNSPNLIIGGTKDVSNKVLAVIGNLTMYGEFVDDIYARLQAPAQPGDIYIFVPGMVSWSPGDQILIAPTQRAHYEYEVHTIDYINKGVVKLKQPIRYYHYGAPIITKTTTYGALDMRAEVIPLTRNIIIEGSDEDGWGGRIYVGEIYDMERKSYFRGRVEIDGVSISNIGQPNAWAGLTFDLLVSVSNDYCLITKSVIRDSVGYATKIMGSKGVVITSNVFFQSYKYQVVVEGDNSNITFNNNILIGNKYRETNPGSADNLQDFIAALYVNTYLTNSQFYNNIIAGCESVCVVIPAADCITGDLHYFKYNTIHSGQIGWIAKPSRPSYSKCTDISNQTVYKLDLGVVTFFDTENIFSSRLIVSDCSRGTSFNTGGIISDTSIIVRDSYYAGLSLDPNLRAYDNKNECSRLSAHLIPTSTVEAKTIPPKISSLPWEKVMEDHIFKTTFIINSSIFANFDNALVKDCIGNRILESNPSAADQSASTSTSSLTLINVGANNLVYFNKPPNQWVPVEKCGGWECTGLKNILVRDLDGTLIGQKGSLIPINSGIYLSSFCTVNEKENAYICSGRGWGVLTFDSQEYKAITRNLAPVKVLSNIGFVNTINSFMDHTTENSIPKRLSRYSSLVQTGQDYKIQFTGEIPNIIRWQLQGASSPENVNVIYEFPRYQSVRITNISGGIVPQKYEVAENGKKNIYSYEPCGTNTYDIHTNQITIKLTSGDECRLLVSLVNSIQGTISYDIPLEEFYSKNGSASFIQKVTQILMISPLAIRIIDIRSGSTVIIYAIDSDYQGNDAENIEAATDQLTFWMKIIESAVNSGEMKILEADIISSSLSLNLMDEEKPSTLLSTSYKVLFALAILISLAAFSIGMYFMYLKCYKNKVEIKIDYKISDFVTFKYENHDLSGEDDAESVSDSINQPSELDFYSVPQINPIQVEIKQKPSED